MKGRMKKMALEVLQQGLKHRDRTTKAACVKALSLIKQKGAKKGNSVEKSMAGKPNIRQGQQKTK
jgi:hypothetical protein